MENSEQYLLVAQTTAATVGDVVGLEPRVRACMKEAKEHWMVTDEEQRFKGALGAALLLSKGEEESALKQSIDALMKVGAALNAMQSGVPVDLEAIVEEQDSRTFEPLPLMQWWREEAHLAPTK